MADAITVIEEPRLQKTQSPQQEAEMGDVESTGYLHVVYLFCPPTEAARRDLNVVSNQKRLDYLNNLTTGVIFATTVVNFFVSFFGSKRTGFFRWLLARLHF